MVVGTSTSSATLMAFNFAGQFEGKLLMQMPFNDEAFEYMWMSIWKPCNLWHAKQSTGRHRDHSWLYLLHLMSKLLCQNLTTT